jgi:hypothetical protein
MKKLNVLLFVIALINYSCTNKITAPLDKNLVIDSGLSGIVTDESGNLLDNVTIFCLFNSNNFSSEFVNSLQNISGADSFGYSLYQNLPNPIYDNCYLRFSLANQTYIELSIMEQNSQSIKYFSHGIKPYGLHQYFLNNFVDSLELENGSYVFSLSAYLNGVLVFEDSKKLFVLSDKGKPASTTNTEGKYLIDYKKACIGDTVFAVKGLTDEVIPYVITENINFLFKKPGFIPKIINSTLIPGVLSTLDVVLIKEGI